jgi:hypothetical protein
MGRDGMAEFLVHASPLFEPVVYCFVVNTPTLLHLPVCFGIYETAWAPYVYWRIADVTVISLNSLSLVKQELKT